MTSPAALRELAHDHLGFSELRPGQDEALRAVIDGRDTLAVMPTGSGKSAIYQLAGMSEQHTTIVVSPLIALQRDQVDSILEQSNAIAAELNSTMSESERHDVFDRFHDRKIAFLFVAPEQFTNEETFAELSKTPPTMMVIDEAHCISDWGHDFRPDYLKLGTVIEQFDHPVIVALTATASPQVRQEIVERLGMKDPAIVIQGFDRPNIHLAVETFEKVEAKREALLKRVCASQFPGIVYAATRRATEEIAQALNECGVPAGAYHAGLKASERDCLQASFMDDSVEVMVATIAFGMGIDKPNVRFVYHHDVSESLDTYYQEVGRAGRDGEPAQAILFYMPQDLELQRFQSGAGDLETDEVEPVLKALRRAKTPVKASLLQDNLDLPDSKLTRILTRLHDTGTIELLTDGQIEVNNSKFKVGEAAAAAVEAQRHHRSFVRSRLEMMRQYAELGDCRRQFLLGYFGEALPEPCGSCDNCETGNAGKAAASTPFPQGSRVLHASLGEGTVTYSLGDVITILFDTSGYKTLSLAIVEEEHLLQSLE
jgi:ATP-dependent DNA helicase RecQ